MIDYLEWFDLIEQNNDNVVIRQLLNNLDGYAGVPTSKDVMRLVALFTAIRMHQLKHNRLAKSGAEA